MSDELERVELRLTWIGLEDVPIMYVNQAIGQVDDQGEIIVTFGQATPPVLLGSKDERAQQVQSFPFVQVRPITRLAFGRQRLEEIIGILQVTLDNQTRVLEDQRRREGPE